MTIQQNPLQAANSAYLKKRAAFRAQLADMEIEIKDDAYADKASGLLNGPKLKNGLDLYVPEWINKPPPTDDFGEYPEFIQMQMDRGDGNFVNVGPAHEFKIERGQTDFPAGTFPFKITIEGTDLPSNASCRFRYTHRDYKSDETDSGIKPAIVDQLPPYAHEPPKAPAFAGDFLDDSNLPAGDKLTVTLPGYPDWHSEDWVFFYLVDSTDIPDDPTTTVPIHAQKVPAPGTTDTSIEIDADKIRAFGDTNALLTYALRDQALNASPPALYKKVSLTFGLLPENLSKPDVKQAVPGPLTMAHVREGVSVWIDKYDNFKGGDHIRLKWGGKTLSDFPIGNNSLPDIEVPVLPALLMLEDYGRATKGNKPTAVSYQVVRQGRLWGPESETFQVNFETVLPWPDPWPPVDWPNPVHPDLLAGEVESSTGETNKLVRADKGEPATFKFVWPDSAANDQVFNFYWRGTRVVEAEVTFDDTETDHVPGGDYEVEISWNYIKNGGNGNPVPVYYTASGPGIVNDLHSETTDVDVNAIAVELPQASFPTLTVPFPGCGALEEDGSLRVAIPDLTGKVPSGQTIKVEFTPMRGDDLGAPPDPITTAIFRKDFKLGDSGFPVTGFEFRVEPYDKHILPLYDENPSTRRGRVMIQYFWNDGTEDIPSDPKTWRTAFHGPNDPCVIPRP